VAHSSYDPPRPYKSKFGEFQQSEYAPLDSLKKYLGLQTEYLSKYDIDRLDEISKSFPVIAGEMNPTKKEWDLIKSWYDGAINYLDRRIGELFDFLKRKGVLEDTYVFIIGDHGDMFGEHGLQKHRFSLFEEVLHVPLIVHTPHDKNKRISNQVSLLDLHPTFLKIAGMNNSDYKYSSSLIPFKNKKYHEYTFAEVGKQSIESITRNYPDFDGTKHNGPLKVIRDDSYKLIYSPKHGVQLYRWQEDPLEKEDLSEEYPEVTKNLLDVLHSELEEFENERHVEDTSDNELRQNLKDLGYI
jgi:arylsulfatase A-like enzyme